MSALHSIKGDGSGPHPFRIHFLGADGVDGSAVIWAMSSDSARRAFAADPKNQWAQIRKIKLDRTTEKN